MFTCHYFLNRTVVSRKADCCRSWLLWMAPCGVDIRVMLICRARSEKLRLEYATLFIAVRASNYYFNFTKKTVYCSVLLCKCILFVLGTAEKQFNWCSLPFSIPISIDVAMVFRNLLTFSKALCLSTQCIEIVWVFCMVYPVSSS